MFKVKRQKDNNQRTQASKSYQTLTKKPKHNPLHFERAYLAHFPLYWSVFYRFGCAKWKITKLLKVPKATDHG